MLPNVPIRLSLENYFMIPCCYILHYKGKTIVKEDSLYSVKEFCKTFISMTEAKKEIDKRDTEVFFNLKKLNAKNQKA